MKDPATPTPSTAAPILPADALARAGALALALSRAAMVSGTNRARLEAVLKELGGMLAASLVACYTIDAGGVQRRAAGATVDTVKSRKQATLARNAAARAAATGDSAQGTPGIHQHAAAPESAAPPVDTIHVLPLATNPHWLGLVIVWSDLEQARKHADVLAQVSPLLCALIPPFVERASRRTRVVESPGAAPRDATPPRKATEQADAYIAGLAHELRNPLNTLAGFLEIVLAEQVGPLNDRQREFLEYARESAARIAQVIEQTRKGTGGHR